MPVFTGTLGKRVTMSLEPSPLGLKEARSMTRPTGGCCVLMTMLSKRLEAELPARSVEEIEKAYTPSRTTLPSSPLPSQLQSAGAALTKERPRAVLPAASVAWADQRSSTEPESFTRRLSLLPSPSGLKMAGFSGTESSIVGGVLSMTIGKGPTLPRLPLSSTASMVAW